MIVDELAQYLDSQGLANWDADAGTGNIYLDTLPDSPDTAVGLMTQPGLEPDVSASARLKRPGVQILVRGGRDPMAAAALAQSIYDALHGLHTTHFVDGGTRIMLCAALQSAPIPLGPDDSGRHEFSINLRLITGGN